jgi:hypothetical protein
MENLHAPTVPSGPTSIGAANGVKTTGQTLAQLQAQKDNMEAELRALSGVLSSVCATPPAASYHLRSEAWSRYEHATADVRWISAI